MTWDAHRYLAELPQSYTGTLPRASASVGLLARGIVPSLCALIYTKAKEAPCFSDTLVMGVSPSKSNGQLHLPRALTGSKGAQNPVSADAVGIAGTVQHVEEISVDAHLESILYGNRFEKRGIQSPLPHTGEILLPPGM